MFSTEYKSLPCPMSCNAALWRLPRELSIYDLSTTMIPFLLNYLGDTKGKAKERRAGISATPLRPTFVNCDQDEYWKHHSLLL